MRQALEGDIFPASPHLLRGDQMKPWEFIAVVGGTALAWPFVALAQGVDARTAYKRDAIVVAQQVERARKNTPSVVEWGAEVVPVALPRGATIKYLVLGPRDTTAAVVLFIGGRGRLLAMDDTIRPGAQFNFLVRSRQQFANQGLFVAILDASSDNSVNGLTGLIRLGANHRSDIRAVINSVKSLTNNAPVWLVGTSSGTISVVNGARKLEPPPSTNGGPAQPVAGIVLTSAQTEHYTYPDAEHSCGVGVQDDPTISSITGPVLVVANTFDQCRCSRSQTNTAPQKGTTLLESLGHSFPKYLMTFGSKHKSMVSTIAMHERRMASTILKPA
jgi:hypothetical protein